MAVCPFLLRQLETSSGTRPFSTWRIPYIMTTELQIQSQPWATADDWEQYKGEITRLYQRKTLKEVMEYMECMHSFYATFVSVPRPGMNKLDTDRQQGEDVQVPCQNLGSNQELGRRPGETGSRRPRKRHATPRRHPASKARALPRA